MQAFGAKVTGLPSIMALVTVLSRVQATTKVLPDVDASVEISLDVEQVVFDFDFRHFVRSRYDCETTPETPLSPC